MEVRKKNAKRYMENKQKIYMEHCRVYSGEEYDPCDFIEFQYMNWTYHSHIDYERYDEWIKDCTNLNNIAYL